MILRHDFDERTKSLGVNSINVHSCLDGITKNEQPDERRQWPMANGKAINYAINSVSKLSTIYF